MRRKRICALALALTLLTGCPAPGQPSPEPSPTPRPTALTWLHGFYASSSYSQIGLTDDMDAVSLGWGRMFVDESGAPYVNFEPTGGNLWVVPEGSHLATGYFAERDIPYNLCVFATTAHAYGETNVLEYLLAEENRSAAVAALVAAAELYSGLTVDFEGLYSESRRQDFSDFMALLRQSLPAGKLLYVAVPPDTWYRGYDYRALGAVCDKVILMAHDYQWTRAPEENVGSPLTDTPVAPIGRVEEALRSVTDPDTGVEELSKVALAIAFSSAGVEVDEEGNLLSTAVYTPGPGTLSARLAQADAEPGWSEEYQSPFVYYHDEEGRRYRVWYENERSVQAKIELCYDYGVTGLSLWRLGVVPNYENYDVWATVQAARGA